MFVSKLCVFAINSRTNEQIRNNLQDIQFCLSVVACFLCSDEPTVSDYLWSQPESAMSPTQSNYVLHSSFYKNLQDHWLDSN